MGKATKRMAAVGILAVAALGIGAVSLRAQDREVAERGLQVTGSYRLGDIETINSKNGNVLLRVPLATLPAGPGGSPGFELALNYNSKLWDVNVEHHADPNSTDPAVTSIEHRTLKPALGNPGWTYNYQYKIDLDRRSHHRFGLSTVCDPNNTQVKDQLLWYEYQVRMVFPDGSVHVFLPEGEATNTYNHDHYFPVKPDGIRLETRCGGGVTGPAQGTATISYYSVDGTYLRLEFEVARDDDGDGVLDTDTLWPRNAWTLYFPDGRRVKGVGYTATRLLSRNDTDDSTTTVMISRMLDGYDNPVDVITDAVGREIIVEKNKANGKHYIYQTGAGGAELKWTVDWGTTTVSRDYSTGVQEQSLCVAVPVVSEITLPAQLGSLSYHFQYNGIANPMDICQHLAASTGLGEISKVTVPWGARASYSYIEDLQDGASGRLSQADYALDNQVTGKVFAYDVAGEANEVTESWSYVSGVTAPDGGVTRESYSNEGWLWKVERLEGTQVVEKVERLWKVNTPRGMDSISARRANPYVKTEFTTLVGSSTKTAIRNFRYDKNGNLLQVAEYDWVAAVPRDSSGRPAGVPGGASAKRVTVHTYHVETPEASNTTTADPDAYHLATSPALKTTRKSTEVQSGLGTAVSLKESRREFTYDSRGNLTLEKIWDSTQTQGTFSDPLTAANSITVSHTYDPNVYGNRISTTDAQGVRTEWTYGDIDVGDDDTEDDLYPTVMVAAAGNASLRRTTNYVYDFWTGAVTAATDVDNGVATRTDLDAVGRPILVKEASGKSEERQTATWYCDAKRRMIVRSDLDRAGDWKLVTVTDYGQEGRVRLNRSYEGDGPTMPSGSPTTSRCSAYDSETAGIKVETRYRYVNSGSSPGLYTLTSNPYRSQTDATMGWTLSRQDRLGRLVEVESYSGSGEPSPWGSSTATTGAAATAYDGEYTTVTDPAGKKRRSRQDGLGRLVRVDEPDSSGNLGTAGSPNQATAYSYDARGNLAAVVQGSQRRGFVYDSLGRLRSASNPENRPSPSSASLTYSYDANSNLTGRRDARGVITSYDYDDLNRLTERRYTGGPSEARSTSKVEYDYDSCGANATYTKGRMCSVTAYDSSGNEFSKTAYTGYDALGRVRGSIQTTDTQSYTMSYEYDRSGNLTSQTYPSGKVVETVYDGAGRIAGVRRVEAGSSLSYYAGADGGTTAIGYAPHGGMREVLLGNGLWEQRRYNDRLQPTQIGLGTGKTAVGTGLGTADSGLLLLDYAYGTSANNGNVASQRIRAGTLDLTQSYTYDDLNRLKTASESGGGTPWSQTYDYDRYGNRAVTGTGSYLPSQALTPQSLNVFDTATNRLDGMNGMNTVTVAYDGAGNLTRDWGGRSFTYDGENRMVSFDTLGTDGDTTYYYDGEGRRVKKAVGGSGGPETIYVYNVAGQLVAEYATSWRPLSGTQYLTQDHLGSTRAVTGPDGAAVSRHDYLPFGEEILGRGGRTTALKYAADSMSGPAQKFTGKERDNESGLDYFGARYFSGAGGRFTSADAPLVDQFAANPHSWNLYVYSRNNPLRFIDPTGRECITLDNGTIVDDGQGTLCDQVSQGDREEQNNPSVTVHTGSLSVFAEAFVREMDRRASGTKQLIFVGAAAGVAGGVVVGAGATAGAGYFTELTILILSRAAPAIDPNKLHHIFGKARHNLDGLVRQYGSRGKVFEAIANAVRKAVRSGNVTTNSKGVYRTTVRVKNEVVTVRGRIFDGEVYIGTAFKSGSP